MIIEALLIKLSFYSAAVFLFLFMTIFRDSVMLLSLHRQTFSWPLHPAGQLLLNLGMQPDVDTGDLARVDHLESAAGAQNTDQGLSRTTTVRGGHRVPVMDLEHAPVC
jgi:hypothetical protein